MPAQKHVIVVGAGIIGASVAWHLAKAGARVTILEAGEAGGVATPNTFAWINASWGNPEPYFRLRKRSMAEWKRLEAEVPDVSVRWTGGLCWDLPRPELDAYLAEHASWGYDIQTVGREEAARIEPALADPPDHALFAAEEGMVEAVPATRALVADAIRLGAVLSSTTTVSAIDIARGRAAAATSNGRIEADEIVLAAGTATPALAATAGIKVPLTAPPGLIVHSKPYRKILNGLVISRGPHFRQTAEGRIIAGDDFGGGDPGDDAVATAGRLFAEVKAALRDAADLELDFHTVGYRPTPEDGFPIIGRAEGVERLYLAVTHSGVTLAPAVGLFAAEEILAGQRETLLEPYRLVRFGL